MDNNINYEAKLNNSTQERLDKLEKRINILYEGIDKLEEKSEKLYKCSNPNCKSIFIENYTSEGLIYPLRPIEENQKYNQIIEALMITRLFCKKCCMDYSKIICINCKIPI